MCMEVQVGEEGSVHRTVEMSAQQSSSQPGDALSQLLSMDKPQLWTYLQQHRANAASAHISFLFSTALKKSWNDSENPQRSTISTCFHIYTFNIWNLPTISNIWEPILLLNFQTSMSIGHGNDPLTKSVGSIRLPSAVMRVCTNLPSRWMRVAVARLRPAG